MKEEEREREREREERGRRQRARKKSRCASFTTVSAAMKYYGLPNKRWPPLYSSIALLLIRTNPNRKSRTITDGCTAHG